MIKNIAVNPTFKKLVKRGTSFVLATILITSSSALDVKAVKKQANQISQIEMVDLTVFRGVNLYIDDKSYIPEGGYAVNIDPFIYKGTTYLPLVSISELFGAEVRWDSNTNTVYVSRGKEKKNFIDKERPNTFLEERNITVAKGIKVFVDGKELKDTDGKDIESYVWDGVTYLPARAIAKVFDIPIYWEEPTNSVYIGKHIIRQRVESFPNDPKLQQAIDTLEKYAPIFKPYSAKILELFNKMSDVELDIYFAIDDIDKQYEVTEEAQVYIDKAYAIAEGLCALSQAVSNCDCYETIISRLAMIEKIKQNGGEYKSVERSILISTANITVMCYEELLEYFATYTDEHLKEMHNEAINYLQQAKSLSTKVKIKSLN